MQCDKLIFNLRYKSLCLKMLYFSHLVTACWYKRNVVFALCHCISGVHTFISELINSSQRVRPWKGLKLLQFQEAISLCEALHSSVGSIVQGYSKEPDTMTMITQTDCDIAHLSIYLLLELTTKELFLFQLTVKKCMLVPFPGSVIRCYTRWGFQNVSELP